VLRLLAEAEVGRKPDLPRDLGADVPRHQRVQALGELALGLVRIGLYQPMGGDQAEHPVAEELQSLIMLASEARMGQRPLEQSGVARAMAEHPLHPVQRLAVHQKVPPVRSHRAALNQVQGLTQLAEPSVEKKTTKARPMTFSAGSSPTP